MKYAYQRFAHNIVLFGLITTIALTGCEQQDTSSAAHSEPKATHSTAQQDAAKQYRIGGVPLKIGSGLLTLFSDGKKYPGDNFFAVFLDIKINPDGSYAYFDTMAPFNKYGYDHELYKKETEEEYLQHNWVSAKILIDFNIENPDAIIKCANDYTLQEIERAVARGDIVRDGERHGLDFYKFIAKRDIGREEYYVKYFSTKSPCKVETAINCSLGVDEAHSTCTQEFTIPGTVLSAMLTYRKLFLPHWRFIQETFIERFNADFVQHDIKGEP